MEHRYIPSGGVPVLVFLNSLTTLGPLFLPNPGISVLPTLPTLSPFDANHSPPELILPGGGGRLVRQSRAVVSVEPILPITT